MLVVDPLVLDRKLDRFRKGKKTLTEMAPVYGAVASPDAHTAEVDVAMTLDVLAGMVDQYPQLASMNALELMDYQLQAHQDWAEDSRSTCASRARTRPSIASGRRSRREAAATISNKGASSGGRQGWPPVFVVPEGPPCTGPEPREGRLYELRGGRRG